MWVCCGHLVHCMYAVNISDNECLKEPLTVYLRCEEQTRRALVTHYIPRALKWKTNALVRQGRLIFSRLRPNASANKQAWNKQNKTKVAGGISFNER